jgi:hypothetical protein
VLAGAALLPLAFSTATTIAMLALFLYGSLSAPLTVWAQTLRMQVIPERLRGRMFALIRTLIQSFGPLGAVFAGVALPILGIQVMILLAATLFSVPGALGLRVSELRRAQGRISVDDAS